MHETASPTNSSDLRRTRLARDYWYPVALSNDLRRGRTLAVQFSEDPIVLVRTSQGSLFALEDRCAHRQMPLSRGRLDGEQLQCAYHGWRYDAEGRCSPPTPAGTPLPVRGVHNYPVREKDGLIFLFPGDASRAGERPVPDIAEARSDAYLSIPFRREVRCHYSFLHENLMDMSHQILHRRWTGNFRPRMLRSRSDGDRVAVDYAADFGGGSALLKYLPGAIIRFQGGATRSRQRGTPDEVTISTDYPYQTLVYRRPGLDQPFLKLWNAYIPVGADESVTRPIGFLLVRRPFIPGLLPILKPLLLYVAQRIFEEDRTAMELEQRAFELQNADWNRESQPFLLDLRRLLIERGHSPKSAE